MHVYFSNETVSQTTVTIEPMKMFRLEHKSMNVCLIHSFHVIFSKLNISIYNHASYKHIANRKWILKEIKTKNWYYHVGN